MSIEIEQIGTPFISWAFTILLRYLGLSWPTMCHGYQQMLFIMKLFFLFYCHYNFNNISHKQVLKELSLLKVTYLH